MQYSPGLDTQPSNTDLADRGIQMNVGEGVDVGKGVLAGRAEDKGTKDRTLGSKWRKKLLQSSL